MKTLTEALYDTAELLHKGEIKASGDIIKIFALLYKDSVLSIQHMFGEIYQEVSTGCVFDFNKNIHRDFKHYVRNISNFDKNNSDIDNASEIINSITYHWGGVKYWPRSRSDHKCVHPEILHIVVNQISSLKCNTSAIWDEFKKFVDKELELIQTSL